MEDLRYGLRLLRRNPGFATVAILTIALGIVANAAVFSIVNAVLLRPLPGVVEPERLVTLYRARQGAPYFNLDYPDYHDFRDRTQTFSGIAAHVAAPLSFGYQGTERLIGDLVSGNYFDVLGAKPALGRLLVPADDTAETNAAVLSYGLWQRMFGGTPAVLGSSIRLNGYPFVVFGITQRGFRGSAINSMYDVWVPLASQPRTLSRLSEHVLEDRSAGWLGVFGRFKPGADFRGAEAEMKAFAAQLAEAYPVTNAGRSISAVAGIGWFPGDRSDISSLLLLVGGAVAVLLVIACANVAGLLMVRSWRRSREIAMRVAVGASRGRIIRQLLTEALVLAFIAGLVGFLVSQWAAQIVAVANQNTRLMRNMDVTPDARVFGFTLIACAVAAVAFALMPALQTTVVDLVTSLKSGSAGAGYRRSYWRSGVVVGQVALSFILLSASAILLRDVYRVLTSNPGFEMKNIAMVQIDMSTLPKTNERGPAFYKQVLERLPSVPGITSASLAFTVPPQDFSNRVSIFYPGQEPPPEILRGHEFELGLRVDYNSIAPRYFSTMGIPLIHGRDFEERDRSAVIVSQRLAERLWPGETAVGKRISWPLPGAPLRAPFEVIGVAADAKYRSLISDPPLLMYVSALETYDSRTHIVARTTIEPAVAVGDIERIVREIDKDVPAFHPETMQEHAADSVWQQRTAAAWIGVFSLMALLLAAIGLYAVIAQSVAERTREMGIRVALGASPHTLSWHVIQEGVTLAAIGMAVGLPATLAIGRVVTSLLEGMHGPGPGTLLAVAVVLSMVMLIACWIPARKAARVDPIDALRFE